MREHERTLEAIHDWSSRGVEFALATVVGVRGSTYRGLGARQLMSADGSSVGTVSGGCLDTDLRSVAMEVIESGEARTVEFDLTADDEAIWGWGIGCNGATRLLVEPRDSAVALADRLAVIRASQRPTAVIHVLSGAPLGSRSEVTHTTVSGSLPSEVVHEARDALTSGYHALVDVEGFEALIEVVGSPSRLIVCGAGHDAAPVVRYGAELGFEVTVVDDRRQFLSDERFPEAAALVHSEPIDLVTSVELDGRCHVVLMSHNYLRDLDYLKAVMGAGVAYVGVLGPGERLRRLLEDLRRADSAPSQSDLARLHGPAGLDLGAEGPEEIAWSIISEILAVRRKKAAGFLTHRKGPLELRG